MSSEVSPAKIDKGKARQHEPRSDTDPPTTSSSLVTSTSTSTSTSSQGQGQPSSRTQGPANFLPSEIILEIVRILQAQWLNNGDPQAERALIAISQTNKLIREWALDALYEVLILPRHVREFRKFYHRQRTSYQPFRCANYTRALFCGLDDVSRLTATTAGWESELMRLLHYTGPHLDHLSLWNAESRVILRDPIQVKGHRTAGARSATSSQWDEASLDDVDFPTATRDEEQDEGPLPNLHDLPGWLRAEFDRLPLREFYRRHKAHVAFRSKTSDVLMVQQRQRGCRPRFLSMVVSFPFYENEAENAFPYMTIWSRVEELDFHVPVTKDVGRVIKLTSLLHRSPLRRIRISSQHASIALALPPFHPSHPTTPSSDQINLARGLGRIHSSCVLLDLVLSEFQGHHSSPAELERLQAVLEAAVISEADGEPRLADSELWRRANGLSVGLEEGQRDHGRLAVREGSLASTLGVGLQISDSISSPPPVDARDDCRFSTREDLHDSSSAPWERFPSATNDALSFSSAAAAASTDYPSAKRQERVRVRIQQRGQDVHGKLKTRLQDFRERAEFGAPGSWATMGLWDAGS